MPVGTYTVGLYLPDAEASLRNDIRYAIQFANVGTWNSLMGINILATDLLISPAAEGSRYQGFDQFAEITDLSQLHLLGDFDVDGDVDGADFRAWQRGESPDQLSLSDLTAWKEDYGTHSLLASSVSASPEPTSELLILVASMFFNLVAARKCVSNNCRD
jgi:hypothetical protein